MNPHKDPVNNPDHYQGSKYEAIDIIEDFGLNFCLGNAIKYILRCDKKGDKKQDLEKAIWYLNRELQNIQWKSDCEPAQKDQTLKMDNT